MSGRPATKYTNTKAMQKIIKLGGIVKFASDNGFQTDQIYRWFKNPDLIRCGTMDRIYKEFGIEWDDFKVYNGLRKKLNENHKPFIIDDKKWH